MDYSIDLGDSVPHELLHDAVDKLAYAHAHVQSCEIAPDGRTLTYRLADPAHATAAEQALRTTLAGIVRGYREVAKDVMWRSSRKASHTKPIWGDLAAAGLVSTEGPGCV